MASRQIVVSITELVESGGLPPAVASEIGRLGGPGGMTKRLAKANELSASARYHRALSDEIRLGILNALSLADLCPCVLKEVAGTSDSKLSYHLKILESEGLISSRRARMWRIYSITRKGRAAIRP